MAARFVPLFAPFPALAMHQLDAARGHREPGAPSEPHIGGGGGGGLNSNGVVPAHSRVCTRGAGAAFLHRGARLRRRKDDSIATNIINT